MPSLKSLLSAAAAFACLVSAKTITITATSDNTFSPNTVTAAKDDILEFHFQPKNHSVVAGDYQYPCSPLQLGTGFFSGFLPTSSGEADKVFRVTVNSTDPMPFYSSQGNECATGMVGIINPTNSTNLTDYTKRASVLAKGVTPGTNPYGGELVENSSSGSDDSNSTNGGGGNGSGSGNGNDKSSAGSISLSMAGLIGAMGLAFFMI